ncbi:glucose-1-phosphate cytidylyltransferase [Daejeonella sp.]|uniref:glucose-1-phosphate cytidylyltransferase n=1 Tax=Daejeonella sp. TaxID=2805397 RepID=UPI002CC4F785|nr:glucose-1-phosphate cytidylyltransferase [Daejeonella sp.]HQT58837.1 glucose-1-phosphate cytidylyltransferase [Daejeonella sp.]
MKVVILAGGFGTRLSEMTDLIPKPMVRIGGHPILWHIMQIYAHHGFNDFVIALGYKSELVKEYFLNYYSVNSDFTVNLNDGSMEYHHSKKVNWKVTLIDTGLETMTGGRVRKLKEYIGNSPFLLTYGDGVADVNIKELVDFHQSHGKMVTITSVHPAARFGEMEMVNGQVLSFKEKPQTGSGWINGGFMVLETEFLDLIEGDQTILEREPLEAAAERNELMAYQHEGFWQCMDTIRDRSLLEELWKDKKAPWKIW